MPKDTPETLADITVQKLDPALWTRTYGALCHALHPWANRAEAPFGASWCRLAPGESTVRHNHHEGETFYIARGSGALGDGAHSVTVAAGDAIYLPPLASHSLRNTSATDELLFLAIFWPDAQHLLDRVAEWSETPPARAAKPRVFILPAPPTPNGDFHLGHLSGPYLGADALARFRRLQGEEVFLVTGTDDHQTYVVTRSWRDQTSPLAVADRFAALLDETLTMARIGLPPLIRPHASSLHTETVQRFFQRIHDNGHFVARAVDAPFCERCDTHLFGGYIEGTCAQCGASSDGAICERCSHPNDCVELAQPRCARCDTAPVLRPLTRLYFPMEAHRAWLLDRLDQIAMVPRVRSLCDRLLAGPLPDVAVSHVTDWGIPVPAAGFDHQRIDVWLEMGAGYLAAARAAAGADSWESVWNDPASEIVHCFGFDNSFFHILFIPALLAAHDPGNALPRALITNEFLFLEGEKFSTSRDHAVWARDLIAASCADAVRLYLARHRPEAEPTSFSREAFEAFTAAELAGRWDAWLTALGQRLARHAAFAADGAESWSRDHELFYGELTRLVARGASCYRLDAFALQEAAHVLSDLVRIAARFGTLQQHLADAPGTDDLMRTSLALELTAAKALAVLSWPLMPDFGEWLWNALGLAATPMTWAEATTVFPYGVTDMRVHAYFGPRTSRS